MAMGAKSKDANAERPRVGEHELALRVIVVAPPQGVLFAVQGKIGEHLGAVRSGPGDLVFDVEVRASGDDPPRILGRVAQGPPSGRFLYVCSGTLSGDATACWTRRAKLPFATITRALVQRASQGGRLVARIDGKAKDGGPACGTVPLLGGGWQWSA